jgi:DNA-binding SARP family transcriptional activator
MDAMLNQRHDASLSITLLGRIAVRTAAGADIRLVGRHTQALFTLLALTRRPRTREAIAADLWPDTAMVATGPLRQALYQLRAALASAGLDPDQVLESDAETLALRPCSVRSIDVAEFERYAVEPGGQPDAAIAIYAGDLAEALAHDCFAAERERLADRFEDALARVAATRLEAGDHEGARRAAERLLIRDPLREEAHAVLIAAYGAFGSRSQVVRQYRRLCAVLARELDERPLPETDATYRAALRHAVRRSRERAAMIDPGTPSPVLVAVRG